MQLLDELLELEKQQANMAEVEELAAETRGMVSHWLLHFPAQCVLTAEAVMWERAVFRALERQDKDELNTQK